MVLLIVTVINCLCARIPILMKMKMKIKMKIKMMMRIVKLEEGC